MNATMPTSNPTLVQTKPRTCLTVAGVGSPDGPAFQEALHALYAVAYGLKFDLKRRGGPSFKAGPLEGLWWTDSAQGGAPNATPGIPDSPEGWNWKLIIAVPDVDELSITRARSAATRRGIVRAADVRFEQIDEGACVELLHVGPYSTEAEDLERMHALMIEAHLRPAGPHHEIYLSDPRRTRPESLRTILRQPVH